ncbi:MAG: transglycosylase domain-containing protein, partial [Desulfobacterota bacterium]|nr:transglycosylase domain-containing protein [Thermodesulfobacteriota bacterium]
MEAHFTKKEIFEFFTNQFYVTGTGRGLAVAAKYFFDKPVNELSLLECAFIAGVVRAPNRYNPLVQPDLEKKKAVFARAMARKNYVLRNMFKLGMISFDQYYRLIKAPIPFKEGKVYYELNVILDYLKEELQSEKFQKILNNQGISNIATSGIKIYTFVNYELQQLAQIILRKHLSRLETMLSGYNRKLIQSRYANLSLPMVNEPKIGQFVFGKVEFKGGKDKRIEIGVKLGEGEVSGKIDLRGLNDIAAAYARHRRGAWAEVTSQDVYELLSQIEVGDLVYVYVREKSAEGKFLFDLEQKPKLEGGVLVSQQGKILAMVGGFENCYFNRVIDAKRQMGSIFKPLVYTAALQLGWNILDPLENRRDVFVFQNRFYFPRPDHEPLSDKVSLAWAGVKSENLASVWLLYHLCDKLSFSQFKQITELVDLSPRDNENYYAFQKRLRDSWGIIVTEDDLREAAFQTAKDEIMTDLIFEGSSHEVEALRFLKHGAGFDSYRAFLLNAGELENELEKLTQLNILKEHFLRYLKLNREMVNQWKVLVGNLLNSMSELNRFYFGIIEGKEIIAYGDDLITEGFIPLTYEKAISVLNSGFSEKDIWIEGKIRSSTLTALEDLVEKELAKLNANRPYDLITLWRIRDFRVLVGLLYVVKLCETLGINSSLEPVLSFPLGPNAVSLLEILQAYT